MQNIDDLRQRVAAATERYSKLDASRRTQSERLITLIQDVEAGLHRSHAEVVEKQAEIEDLSAEVETLRKAGDEACAALDVARDELAARDTEVARLDQENAELRAMIASLLQPLEGDADDGLDDAVAHLDSQVGTLAEAPVAEAHDMSEESPDEIVADEIADEIAAEQPAAEETAPEADPVDMTFTDVSEETIAAEAAEEAEAELAAAEAEAEAAFEIEAEPQAAVETAPQPETVVAAAPEPAAGIPSFLLDTASEAKSGANRPSTVRKIIERVSALAEELEQARTASVRPAPAPAPAKTPPKRAAAG